METSKLIIQQIHDEQYQGHSTRRQIYQQLEDAIGIPVISFFTSFRFPVSIEDSDADMLEGIFQKSDISKGFALLLSSPGGSGLAAERIINICRSYSGTQTYTVIVPGKAKSAATIICLGASKIIMGKISELGSIDPQIVIEENGKVKWFAIYNVVHSYDDLFERAVKEEGNLQPYLQQLANYDAREIAEFRLALSLSEDMAIKVLKTGIMSKFNEDEIKKKIKIFLTPETVKTHGRPIYSQDVSSCGLNVEIIEPKEKFWPQIYELYVRLNSHVMTHVAKCIESKDYSFNVNVPKQ